MRRVVSNPEEAHKKGVRARADMQAHYSPDAVSAGVIAELNRIEAKLTRNTGGKGGGKGGKGGKGGGKEYEGRT